MNESKAARLFGVNLSYIKRHARTAKEGKPFAPRKAPGKRPKIDEQAQKTPLEADLEERPAVTLVQRCSFSR